jgi:pimeloyl-ACP methyl ester carboxylesterase
MPLQNSRLHTVWMTIRGRRVRCRILDTPRTFGPPLLLVHGLAGSASVWGPFIKRLRNCGYTALAPDLPGSGYSDGSEGPLGVDGMADWIAELLEARGISQTHVVAHSLGSQVALALARRHPDRVARLVLAGPTLGHQISIWRYALGAVDVFREPPIFNLLAAWMFAQMGPQRYWEAVRHMHRDNPLRDISLVHAPCLVLRGTHDAVIPETSARNFAAQLPHGVFEPIPGAPHVAPYATPDALISLALPFLDTLRRL